MNASHKVKPKRSVVRKAKKRRSMVGAGKKVAVQKKVKKLAKRQMALGVSLGSGGEMKTAHVTGRGRVRRRIVVKPIPWAPLLASDEFVPQAVLKLPIKAFADALRSQVVSDANDFDAYEGTAFTVDGVPVTVMHYRGHPANTATVYLPYKYSKVDEITKVINLVLASFSLPRNAIIWQRKDDPDL